MIDIEAIKQAALAAAKGEKSPHPIQARFLLEATPSAVLELFAKLSVAEAASKFWESHANDLATQDNKLIAEMTQQAIEAENVITDLTAKLEAVESNQILRTSARQFKQIEERLEAEKYNYLRAMADCKHLKEKLEAAENELERGRIRLAVCGTAARGYFEGCLDEYESASLDDVLLMRDKLEAAERDAERYRWLRTNPDWETYRLGTPIVFVTCNEEALPAQEGELDIAVDAAMKESK